MVQESLFGSDFAIDLTPKNSVKSLINKVTAITSLNNSSDDAFITKALKSNKLSIQDQLVIINDRVLKVLGKQRQNVLVIRDLETLNSYIQSVISTGYVAIDTETNNSLDPVTCKLMGLCLYAPGLKQVYVPVNHENYETGKLLVNQLTEADCASALKKIIDSKITIIMHNGKFDYEVLKCTCGVEVKPDWDTMIAARLLDENELASLKDQYVKKIDPSQEKYSIEKLFVNIPYAYVDPDIFALYAASDSLMTYRLYEWQYPRMTSEDNKRLFWLFTNIEMPIVVVTAEMELKGVKIDVAFGKKLEEKYSKDLEELDAKIMAELETLKPKITAWRLDPANNARTKMYPPKKTKKSIQKIEEEFYEIDKDGKRFKWGKAKTEQLADPINLASPVQLAILIYDILKAPVVSKKAPRGTGEEELQAIIDSEKIDSELCKLILERRGLVKILTTYIQTIPTLAEHWPDGRIRFHLSSLGTDTGRYSSGGTIKYMDEATKIPIEVSGINIQNIPSRGEGGVLRMLFIADQKYTDRTSATNFFEIPEYEEVETSNGWKYCRDLALTDSIITDEGTFRISTLDYDSTKRQYLLKLA